MQPKLCLTAFDLKHGIVCTAKGNTSGYRGFAFCACRHKHTEDSLLQSVIWKVNLEQQADMGDEEKDKLRVVVFTEKT